MPVLCVPALSRPALPVPALPGGGRRPPGCRVRRCGRGPAVTDVMVPVLLTRDRWLGSGHGLATTRDGAGHARQLAVVDEADDALGGQWAGVPVRVDGEVGQRVAADRVQESGAVPRDDLDVAVEQYPVPGLRLVTVAERMPALMCLSVLQHGDDVRR